MKFKEFMIEGFIEIFKHIAVMLLLVGGIFALIGVMLAPAALCGYFENSWFLLLYILYLSFIGHMVK